MQLPQKSTTEKELPFVFLAFDARQHPKLKSLLSLWQQWVQGLKLLTLVSKSCHSEVVPCRPSNGEDLKIFGIIAVSRELKIRQFWVFYS